jgi:hypothetical protein
MIYTSHKPLQQNDISQYTKYKPPDTTATRFLDKHLTELVAPFSQMGTSAFAFKLQEPSQLYALLLVSFCLTNEEEFAQRIWKMTCLTLWSKIDRISPQGCGIQRKWISRAVRALKP